MEPVPRPDATARQQIFSYKTSFRINSHYMGIDFSPILCIYMYEFIHIYICLYIGRQILRTYFSALVSYTLGYIFFFYFSISTQPLVHFVLFFRSLKYRSKVFGEVSSRKF